MNQWKSKNTNKDPNHNSYGTTDYNIPMFSYKSALLIVGSTFLATVLVVWLTNGNRQAIIVTLAVCLSVTTAYSQFFIDRKLGYTKNFYLTLGILFLSVFVILQFVNF